MKKVWILEKFATAEEMVKVHAEYEEWFEDVKVNDPDKAARFEKLIENHKRMIEENPNGRWYGFEGKFIYRQFCDVAKAAIRRNPDGKFRVVEAEIEDDAKYWTNYKMTKVNDGVLRYLMATK